MTEPIRLTVKYEIPYSDSTQDYTDSPSKQYLDGEKISISTDETYETEPIKKRKLNADSNDCQTTSPDFQMPKPQVSTQQESYSNFDIIQEVEENETHSYTEYASFQNGSHCNRTSSTNPLKRKLESELPVLTTSIEVSSSHYQLECLEDVQKDLQQRARIGLHTGLCRERQTLGCQSSFQNEGRLSKLKAKELSKEAERQSRLSISNEAFIREPMQRSNSFRHSVSKFENQMSGANKHTPIKKKVIYPPVRTGSQSVCKVSGPSQSQSLWSNKRNESKLTIPAASMSYKFKAKPMPKYVPFEAKKSDRPCVIPEEFHLMTDERGRVKQQNLMKEMEVKKELENSCKSFKAAPVPSFEKASNEFGSRGVYNNTRPSDFSQYGDERTYGTRSVSKGDIRADSTLHSFRALPMPDFSKPFKPKYGLVPLTDTTEFSLNTEIRAEKRAEFDLFIRERQSAMEIVKQQKDEEMKQKEKEDLIEFRKTLQFKAKPFRDTYSEQKVKFNEFEATNGNSESHRKQVEQDYY